MGRQLRRVGPVRGPFELFCSSQARLGRVVSSSELWLLRELCRDASRSGLVSGRSFAYFAAIKGQSREWVRRLFRRLEAAGFVRGIGKAYQVVLADALAAADAALRERLRAVRALVARRSAASAAFVNSQLTIKKIKETKGLGAATAGRGDVSTRFAHMSGSEPGFMSVASRYAEAMGISLREVLAIKGL